MGHFVCGVDEMKSDEVMKDEDEGLDAELKDGLVFISEIPSLKGILGIFD